MSTAHELFALAMRHHHEGAIADAEMRYLQTLQADPSHADVYCFLGAIYHTQGKLAAAEAHFRRAIKLVPGYTSAHTSLGILLAEQGKLDEAAVCFLEVLKHDPADADAHNNLGQVRARQGQFEVAIACYQRALQIQPNHGSARSNLDLALRQRSVGGDVAASVLAAKQRGVALAQQGRLEEAKLCFQEALTLNPDDSDALNNFSSALILQDRFDEALPYCQAALRLRPTYPQALNNLGNVRQHQGMLDEAVQCFQRAVQLSPSYPDAWYNLANTLKRQDKLDDAVEHYRQTIRLMPDHRDAHNNLGVLLHERGKFDEALTQLDEAVRLHPNNAEARWNRGLLRLTLGDWQRGWSDYEWRWKQKGYPQRSFPQPLWDGADLTGKTILIFAEQGLGDTLQYVRYIPLVKNRGGKVIVECQPALSRLLALVFGADQLLPRGAELPAFDVQAPMPSLPGILGTTLDNIPTAVPYLHPDPQLVEYWRLELDRIFPEPSPLTPHPFKIGIAWQGDPSFRHDRQRSIPLREFAPLAELKGVHLISLQKGQGTEQIHDVSSKFAVHDLSSQLDENSGAFMDTAAVMKNLDLVISSDTSIAHLAGALGVPVWVALPLVSDWRWLLRREDSPWYPTMRLFRQKQFGDWQEVFERIVADGTMKFNHGFH